MIRILRALNPDDFRRKVATHVMGR
jgi:hypothetical protein